MLIKQKLKSLWTNKFSTGQMLFFILGKICFLMVELPRSEKQSSIIIELILASLFYTLSISFKIIQYKASIMREVPKMLVESFLPCIIGILVMMFTFALQDKLKFIFLQKMLSMLVIALQILCLILLTRPKFITKREFIFYEIILAINVLVLADKCIWFLAYDDDESKVKDILLLNLTTQIALSIVFMEYLNQTYKQRRRNKTVEFKDDSSKIQRELQMTNN